MEIKAKYGEAFGGKSIQAGFTFCFPNFQLEYLYFREPNSDEKRKWEESNEAGLDGGASMLAPFNGFQIKTLDHKEIGTFELSLLPYAWHEFSIDAELFRMEHMAPHTLDQWIVLNGVESIQHTFSTPD